MDDTGFEPVTPSMSRKCATTAPIVRVIRRIVIRFVKSKRTIEPISTSLTETLISPILKAWPEGPACSHAFQKANPNG